MLAEGCLDSERGACKGGRGGQQPAPAAAATSTAPAADRLAEMFFNVHLDSIPNSNILGSNRIAVGFVAMPLWPVSAMKWQPWAWYEEVHVIKIFPMKLRSCKVVAFLKGLWINSVIVIWLKITHVFLICNFNGPVRVH